MAVPGFGFAFMRALASWQSIVVGKWQALLCFRYVQGVMRPHLA
jgi:hypothetical protein